MGISLITKQIIFQKRVKTNIEGQTQAPVVHAYNPSYLKG
jgi:hypothetical protein